MRERTKVGVKASTEGMEISSLTKYFFQCLQYFRHCAGSGIITVNKNNTLSVIRAFEENEQEERMGVRNQTVVKICA